MLSLSLQELNIHTITFYITITDILKTLVRAQNNFYMIITLYHVLVMDVHLYSILKLCQGFFLYRTNIFILQTLSGPHHVPCTLQYHPGVHCSQEETLWRPVRLLKVPTGHFVSCPEPAGQ